MKHHIFFGFGLFALGFMACSQTPNVSAPSAPSVLGVLEVRFDSALGTQAKFMPNQLRTQGVITESQISVNSAGAATIVTENNGVRKFDYVAKNFTVTNSTGGTLNNLTLVALEKPGNLAGAIKTAVNFGGSSADANTAALARPSHAMIASGGQILVDNATPSRAGFQALTSAEASDIESDPNFASQGLAGAVLEYGFVATNAAGTNRSIDDGASGNLTIAYRFPTASTPSSAYNFVVTFVVTTEAANRVTRSPEETSANADARADLLEATETLLIDSAVASLPAGFTNRVDNVKISSTKNLLKEGKLVIARVYNRILGPSATFTRQFVELFNAGEQSVSLVGKTLQVSATATGTLPDQFSSLNAGGVMNPGSYRLVRIALPSGIVALPANPDISLPSSMKLLENSGQKIALASINFSLNCSATGSFVYAPSPTCANVIDMMGHKKTSASSFPSANLYEGNGPADQAEFGNQATTRQGGGCTDTDNNDTDFTVDTITNSSLRSSSTPAFICP
jgi:hypothetical protein